MTEDDVAAAEAAQKAPTGDGTYRAAALAELERQRQDIIAAFPPVALKGGRKS